MENQFAWMAGIIDGEGTITLAKQIRRGRPSPSYRQMVTVANCDLRILQPFLDHWGGCIYTSVEKREGYSDSSIWHCPMSKNKELLEAVLPYLKGKKEQALVLLYFIEHKNTFKRYKGTNEGGTRGGSLPLSEEEIEFRQDLWEQFKVLNAKGKFKKAA